MSQIVKKMNEKSNKYSVLITGINGFIGKSLAIKLINNDFNVIGTDINDKCDVQNIIYYKCDITDYSDFKQITTSIDFIIHLAALTNPNLDRNLIYNVNVKGVENICNFAKLRNIKKIIYISTVSVYSSYNLKYIDENVQDNPINYYGETKLLAEKIIKNSGIDWTILRPTNIFGGKDVKYKNYFRKIKYRGKRLGIVFYYNRNLHLLYLNDLIDVIKECIENPKSNNQTFIVSDNKCNTFEKNVLKELIKIFNIKKRLCIFPLFWKNKDKRIFLSSKLRKHLDYEFKYGVYEGLKECNLDLTDSN